MKRQRSVHRLLAAAAAAIGFSVALPASLFAGDEEIPFSEASIFFELNDTDGDLGIHAKIDGRPWRSLAIEGPDERRLMSINLLGRLRQQGLTELFFESAEPPFDELSPERFFRRFPEGEYEIEGITLDGRELESEVEVSHVLPAPVEGLNIDGVELPEDCDADLPVIAEPSEVSWDEVTESHPEIGTPNEKVEVVNYQLVIEREDPPLNLSVDLGPEATSFELPTGLVAPGQEIKVEVLVREVGGNQTAVETCFIVGD